MNNNCDNITGTYRATQHGDKDYSYIIRFENGVSKECINLRSYSEDPSYSNSSGFWKEWGTYVPASFEEEQWLRDSIKAGMVAEKRKPISSLLIF